MADGDTLVQWNAFEATWGTTATNVFVYEATAIHVVGCGMGNDVSDEIHFAGIMPRQYAGGDLTVNLWWMSPTTTASNNVRWGVEFWSIVEDTESVSSNGYASGVSVTDTTTANAYQVQKWTNTFTNAQADSMAGGDAFMMRVSKSFVASPETEVTGIVIAEILDG